MLLAAFFFRLATGLGVYALAWRANPQDPLLVLNSWLLAPDANQYHLLAQRVAEYWHGQSAVLSLGLPDKFLGYPLTLAGVYYLLGSHPLWGVLLNCLAFLGIGLLAHRLALLLGQSANQAKWIALLVALWPPSLAYSSVLLKDSLCLLAVFILLTTLGAFLRAAEDSRGPQRLLVGGGLLAGSYMLIVIRPEFGAIAILVSTGTAIWALLWSKAHGWRWAWPPMIACLLVSAGVFLGTQISPIKLLPENSRIRSVPHSYLTLPTANLPKYLFASLNSKEAVSKKVREILESIWQRRWEYATSGGVSLLPGAHLIPDSPRSLAVILLNSVRNLLLYPYPWQRWPSRSKDLGLRIVITGQSLFWYFLLPGLAWGLIKIRWRSAPGGAATALWALVVGLALGVMVVNFGTLYRIRDLALLPLLLFLSKEPYRYLWDRWPLQWRLK